MNRFLKSALCVAGAVGIVGAAALEAQALSFTVVIDKIELVGDGDNYPNTATTIYEPRAGIGETVTKTVDLFDATEKLGVAYALRQPDAGEYESALIYFSSIQAVSGAATYDMLTPMTTASLLGTSGAHGVMVLGDDGDGTADSLGGAFANSFAPMQSVVANGAITFPTLDFNLPETAVVANTATTIQVTEFPSAILAVSQATDSASRANLLVDVDADTAFTAVSLVNGASVVTVGLFPLSPTPIPEKPLVATTFTAPSPAAVTQVEFIDAPNATLVPIAWLDADGDGRLDVGEEFTFHNVTVATNTVAVSGTADVSYTAMGSRDVLDTVSIQMGPRAITLTIDIEAEDEAGATIVNDGWDAGSGIELVGVVLDAGADNVINTSDANPTTGSLTIVYALTQDFGISRTFSVDTAIGVDAAGTNTRIDTTEDAYVGLLLEAGVDPIAGVTLDDTNNQIDITGIPLFIDVFGDALNQGTYRVAFQVTLNDDAGANDGNNTISLTPQWILGEDGSGTSQEEDPTTLALITLDGNDADAADTDGLDAILITGIDD